MLSDIVITDGLFGSAALAGLDRRQAGAVSQAGPGALSFADVLLMLLAKDPLSPNLDGQVPLLQADEDEPDLGDGVLQANASVVLSSLGLIGNQGIINFNDFNDVIPAGTASPVVSGTDIEGFVNSAADLWLLDRLKSETLPFLSQVQPSDLSFEEEAAIREPVEQNDAPSAGASELKAEGAVPEVLRGPAAKPIAARFVVELREANGPENSELEEAIKGDKLVSLSLRRSDGPSEESAWEELRSTAGEARFRISRGREEKSLSEEAAQSLRAAEGLGPTRSEQPETADEPQKIAQSFGLARQISTGIAQRLREGRSEFVVKLRPEKLGAITVRLIEESGKMTLRIEAARAETAKLINSDLSSLREAVSPMQVEVHEAVTAAPESSQAAFHQLGAGWQQQFANNQPFNRDRDATLSHSYEFKAEPEDAPARPVLISTGFYRYV